MARSYPSRRFNRLDFPGIGRTVDDDTHAFAQNATAITSREESGDAFLHAVQSRAKFCAFIGANPFFGKIDRSLDVREQFSQIVANPPDGGAKAAFELFRRGTQRKVGLRADQIHHRFRLRQVHFPIQESAFGEFAATRSPRSRPQTSRQDASGHEHTAVATNLDHIFAGVAVRSAMHREHHLVDHAIVLNNFAELLDVRLETRTAAAGRGKRDRRLPPLPDPERRINPIAPSPGGLEIAAMVSPDRRVRPDRARSILPQNFFQRGDACAILFHRPDEMRTHSGRL